MRYIRTKNGILDLDKYVFNYEDTDLYILKYKKHRKNGQDYSILYKKFIIKQADTIEELCDFFDVLWCDEKYEVYLLPKEKCCITILLGYPKNKIREWRFGIKTDKGLIYVAKMNEKEELELL